MLMTKHFPTPQDTTQPCNSLFLFKKSASFNKVPCYFQNLRFAGTCDSLFYIFPGNSDRGVTVRKSCYRMTEVHCAIEYQLTAIYPARINRRVEFVADMFVRLAMDRGGRG